MVLRIRCAAAVLHGRLRTKLFRAGDAERGASVTEAVLWAAVAAALIIVVIGIINTWATGLMNSLPGVP